MDFLLLVFLVVFRATQGSRTCNLSDAVGTVKCSGTVGEPIILHLPSVTTGLEIRLYKDQQRGVFRLRNNESKVYPDYVNRSKFFTNGTFWLDSAVRTDRGLYQLQIFSSDGRLTQNVNMTLQIQAPVSEPVLSVICLSGGETQVTCSSEGEPVEYRWSLDSQSPSSNITSNQSNHYATITLRSHVTGSLTCEVQNDIITNSSTIQLPACSVVSSEFRYVTLAVMVSVTVAILLSLFLGVRHFLKKTRSQNVHSGGGGEEVTYADVVVGRRRERDTPSHLPQDVVYAQVKMGVALERSK